MSYGSLRRVSAEHGHPVQRILHSADARLLATAHALTTLAHAAPRGLRAELDRAHMSLMWPRIADGALAFLILGGVIAVPAACAFALLTGLLPASAPLRLATPQLFGLAVLWFLGAIIGAHFQPRRAG